ncbi:hypothetical protein TCAL_10251 [Tigriopus californicus]|uniref:Protein kinase domain-containing protein n=1 Tax=Tigriopus californicus TaxID=6832 RepID=A0A553NFZ3_TIGCA|nr:uncharacterized protein LOC131887912 [Tigriopus californicus]TRY64289.1 hypothetical protein TCAL_10251 [Tigriopus californicus]
MSESLDLPILNLSDEFEKIRVLSSPNVANGSFGSVLEVYKAKNPSNVIDILYLAVKKYPQSIPSLSKVYNKSLKDLKHKHLVRIFGETTLSDGLVGLVTEAHPTNLRSLLNKGPEFGKPLAINGIRNVISQVLDGLIYLHMRKVVLIHLKPENVILDSLTPQVTMVDSKVKISDFGFFPEALLSDIKAKGGSNMIYLAPELKKSQPVPKIKPSADIFSCGMITFEMICGRSPRVTDKLSMIPNPTLQDFVRLMVKRNPSERIGAEPIFTHSFLRS